MEPTYMGYEERIITPEKPVQMAGYDARIDNCSRGVMKDLKAQILVIKKNEERFCLITIDSLGFTVELTSFLRRKAAEILSAKMEQVMICFSHTHAAPNAAVEKEYYDFVCQSILSGVKNADESMVPVYAGWGIAENTVGMNRRESNQPIDPRMGILKICGEDQEKIKVLVVRVTAHCNVLMPDNYLISPDYFGEAREALERRYGCNVMMVQGASGDVRPRYRQENADYLEIHPAEEHLMDNSVQMKERSDAQSQKALKDMAEAICESLYPVVNQIKTEPVSRVSMFSVKSSFYADVPALNRAGEIAAEAWEMGRIDGKGWLREVERLLNKGEKKQGAEIEIQFFAVNDGCLCGVPNEVMSDIAVNIWKKSNNPMLFFNGYTNGCSSYLPTAAEYDKGGFEVLWSNLLYYQYHGRVMPLNRDTAKRLEDEVVKAWKEF
ncbi:hypothetical protein BXY41_112193 [Lacrimispora xylanisolvens]|uniref:Neutral/alkaline ceramidase-like enzyme n=1 Tax=Lacrimispora xylanisolvens TaxID=384636 RepID=A0A2S6HNU5_9FIRM|nr:hypothetical protein [Hungatella xylanolytica]MBE5989378.1 hypothetical protein [Paenibacillaceae bacterium]PPK79033.1 hypothetical protein BXY41_112193 [Hungatella xylanolytica]